METGSQCNARRYTHAVELTRVKQILPVCSATALPDNDIFFSKSTLDEFFKLHEGSMGIRSCSTQLEHITLPRSQQSNAVDTACIYR